MSHLLLFTLQLLTVWHGQLEFLHAEAAEGRPLTTQHTVLEAGVGFDVGCGVEYHSRKRLLLPISKFLKLNSRNLL